MKKNLLEKDIIGFIMGVFIPLFVIIPYLAHPYLSHAQLLNLNTGMGIAQINTKTDNFLSKTEVSRMQAGLCLLIEKEDSPLSLSFKGNIFSSDKAYEDYKDKESDLIYQENSLDISGISFESSGYYSFYTYKNKSGSLGVSPFLGGGILYKRFKLKREELIGGMMPLNGSGGKFFLGSQKVLAIGALPLLGITIHAPQKGLKLKLDVGRGVFSASSSIDYQIIAEFLNSKTVYPLETKSSGYSMYSRVEFSKIWESFFIAIGYEWEKIHIDDKSVFLFQDLYSGNKDSIAFPDLTIENSTGFLTLGYLF